MTTAKPSPTDERTVSGALTSIQASTALTSAAGSGESIRNVVLVHGAYADGSSWHEVIERLQRAGLTVTAVQNPLVSLADDTAHTDWVLDRQDGPTILVGHSRGHVITQTGMHPVVAGLVFVAATAPTSARTSARWPRCSRLPRQQGLVYQDGLGSLSEEAFLHDFANGVDQQGACTSRGAGRVSGTLFADRTTMAAWKSKPSWYAISTQDRTISPELQRFLARRMDATTIKIDSGHLTIITHPQQITQLIFDAARTRNGPDQPSL